MFHVGAHDGHGEKPHPCSADDVDAATASRWAIARVRDHVIAVALCTCVLRAQLDLAGVREGRGERLPYGGRKVVYRYLTNRV